MVRPLPVELQNSIKSSLLQNTPFSVIRKRYPSVSLSTLTRYKKKFLSSATLPAGGRPSFVSVSTQQYIARMLRNGRQDGPKAVQEYLRSIEIDMSLSGVRKLLKRIGFKPRRKIKTNFISKKKQVSSAGMGQKTLASYDGLVEALDSGDILQPYQTEPYVEGDGGSVLFRGCITANGPGYGTTVMDGSIDSTVYVDILQPSLLDTLEYYDMNRNVIPFQQDNATPYTSRITQGWFSSNDFIFEMIRDCWPAESLDLNSIEHVWYQVKLRLNTYPTRPTTKEELEARITNSMPARIKAVIRSGGGPTRF
ncbi:hypothetical protein INT46_009427 [Mucor plumbeus]|uniref:Transposase n=1 Tax=Mucor plumbeus TaxID=97098 RepID=A0A8H7RLW6_9FUNG|nr:hypothetical protein INT46_009427 [Mucor plumbeus]